MEGEAVKRRRIEKLVLALGSLPPIARPRRRANDTFGGNRA